jgi:hypothetical protein
MDDCHLSNITKLKKKKNIHTHMAKLPTYYLPTTYPQNIYLFLLLKKGRNPKVTMKTYHPDPRFADRCSRPVVLLVTETNLGG